MMKPTSYGSQNTEEEGRAFVRREVVPPPSRAARSRASARKRVIAGASVVLVGAAVAATCGYVAMSGSSVSTSEDTTTKAVAEPLSLQAATLLESLTAQVGMEDVATFDSLDVDGDGFVTKDEYVGRLEKRRDDVLDKLTQSNLADDVKQPVAAIIRDNFDTEAACVARVFDSSGNKAVDRDAFTFVNPLVISFCKKTNTDALTAGLIPANPDQQEGGGGGETIDGDIPSPTSPGDAGETIDGDVPSPSSPGDGGETIDGDVSSPTEPPGDSGETIDGDEPLPTESPTDGGGETIDGDEPLPETDAPAVSIDGDDVPPEDTSSPPASDDTDGDDTEPTSPPGNPDDDSLLTDSPSADETEGPPSLTDAPIDDSLPGEQISPQPGLPGTPTTYDDNNAEGSGLGDTTSEPSDSPDATDAPAYDDDGPTGDDTTPTTDAPGDDNTVDTPSSDAAGPSDEVPTGDNDSTSTPSSPADNGSDVSEPGSPSSDGSTASSDTPAADEPGSSTSSGSTASSDTPTMDEPNSPTSDGSNTDAPATDEPETPMSETPEPWDPSTPSDPNVDAADISPGPVVWDPSEPSMPPSDEVTNVPGIEEPSPSADTPSGSGSGSQAPAPTSPPGSLTSEIDNALKDLTLPNDGTNTTTGGDNGDPAVIQKFLDELNPNSTDSGSSSPAPEEIKSAERVAFEEELKKLLQHEIKDHAQRLAYANLQIKKNAFMLELIEECVTHAGRRFELDPSFTSDQAIAWIKNDCLVFPHNVMHDASN